jgi:thermitase
MFLIPFIMKKSIFVLLIILWPISLLAQKVSSNQVLVYFNTGIVQESRLINGISQKMPSLNSDNLKTSLSQIGIEESMIEVAVPNFNLQDTIKTFENGIQLRQPDMSRLYKIIFPSNVKIDDIIKKLSMLPQVGYVHQDGKTLLDLSPNDTHYGDQWHLHNSVHTGADIHATSAWDIYTGNSNNIIGIIDYGVDITHRDLDSKISGGDSGYSVDHGTHVAGIAAAETNNNQDVSGVDWNARIHPQRIDTGTSDADTYQAIVDAVNYSTNVKVLNNSWELVNNDLTPGRYSFTVGLAIAYAYNANRTVVASMGNDENLYPGVVAYPAGYENVVSVGASDNNDQIPYFSRTGSHIDVVAPGVNITSTMPNNSIGVMSGTSMAAPCVSGLASLLVGYNSNLTVNDVANIINLSADDINYSGDPQIGPGFDVKSGYGRINAARALSFLQAPNSLNKWTASSGTDYNVSSSYQMQFVGVSGLATGTYIVKKHEVRKTVTFPNSFCNLIGCWGRGINTNGFSLASPNYGMGFCDIVPGTLTTTGATVRTYVYEVWNMLGQYLGYYPTTPTSVTFAYTVLGIINPTLSGPTLICTTNSTFNLNNLPSGSTVVWSKSSNLTIVSSSSTYCTVISNGNGTGWVSATISGNCSPFILTNNVWAGTPIISVTGPSSGCTNNTYNFTASPTNSLSNASNYTWELIPLNGNYLSPFGYQNNQCAITFYNPYSASGYTVGARAQNSCGTGGYGTTNIWIHTCYMFSLSPNPASETVTVTKKVSGATDGIANAAISEDATTIYTIRIIDFYGALHYSATKSGDSFTFPVGDLKDGQYIVQITDGKNPTNLTLIVKH